MLLNKQTRRCPSSYETMASSHLSKPQNRHAQLLMQFNEDIFKRNVLTDVECVVEGQVFKTHRSVLVCFSPYLKKKLLNTTGKLPHMVKRIQIPKIGSNEFEILLRYMYTGNVEIDCHTFLDVYKAASLLEMQDAKLECLQVIDGSDEIRTYIYTYVLSKKLNAQQNCQRAFKLITHRFEESVFSKEFMQLNINHVVEILLAQTIGARSETIVFLAALNWLNHDYGNRSVHAATVMECVRFSSMTMEEIVACYHPPFLSQVVQIPEVIVMLFRATCYIAAKSQGQESWFKQYASPKRILTLECLPMELWHTRSSPPTSAEIDSQWMDFGRPVENEDAEQWNPESLFSRLKNPVEVIAGNTGQENKHMDERADLRSSRYNYTIPVKDVTANVIPSAKNSFLEHNSHLNDPSSFPANNVPKTPADLMSENLPNLNDFDEEFESDNEHNLKKVDLKEKNSLFKKLEKCHKAISHDKFEVTKKSPSELCKSGLSACNDVHYVCKEHTKIIHLIKAPQKFSGVESKSEQKEVLKSQEQNNAKKGSILNDVLHQVERRKVSEDPKSPKTENLSSRIENTDDVQKKNVLSSIKHSLMKDKNITNDEALRIKDASSSSTKAYEPSKSKVQDKIHLEKVSLLSDEVASSMQETIKNARIFIVGGMNPKNFKKETGGEVLILDAKENKWTFYSRLPAPRHNHCAGYLDNCLYVVGGCNPQETIEKNCYLPKRTCFKLNLKNLKWLNVPDLKCCRYDHGLVIYKEQLFVIGGQDENGRLLKSVEVYDPRRNRWRFLHSNMCCGRKTMGVAVYANRIWIVGGVIQSGRNSQLQAVSHVDCYDPEEKKWYFNLYSLPGPRCFCSLIVWNDKLYCIGGMIQTHDGNIRPTDEVWFVDNLNELWKKGPSLPGPRIGGVAVTFGRNLYFLGGFDPGKDCDVQNVSILTPGAISWDIGPPLTSHLFGLSAISFSVK